MTLAKIVRRLRLVLTLIDDKALKQTGYPKENRDGN